MSEDAAKHGNCPFCDSTRGSHAIERNDHFLAIYNIAPIVPGHTLIIPARHVESVLALSESEMAEFFSFARHVTSLLLKVYSATAFNWSIQEGAVAGQTITHLHLHIIPRQPADLPNPDGWYQKLREMEPDILDEASRRRLSESEIAAEIRKIRAALAG